MDQAIVWEKSLTHALGLARKENKLVLTLFLSPVCQPCDRMKKNTLLSEIVQEYMTKHFVPLQYESGMDSEQFMRFDVPATPATVVLDAEGNEIFRSIGYLKPELFIEDLEKARKLAGK
jgi:thioredoxin-related protein